MKRPNSLSLWEREAKGRVRGTRPSPLISSPSHANSAQNRPTPYRSSCIILSILSPQLPSLNFCVYDSTWEASEAFALDRHPAVAAWVKNDHLGFEVLYIYHGVVRKYRPDFLIRFASGDMLVLETKGQDSEQDQTKRRFLDEWVKAVNAHGGFGPWSWAVSTTPGDVPDLLARHAHGTAA